MTYWCRSWEEAMRTVAPAIHRQWAPGSFRVFYQQENPVLLFARPSPCHFVMAWDRVAQRVEFTPGVRYILCSSMSFLNSATWKSHEKADFNFEHPRLNLKSCISNRIAYHDRVNAWSTRLCSKSLELPTGKAINNFRWFASTQLLWLWVLLAENIIYTLNF